MIGIVNKQTAEMGRSSNQVGHRALPDTTCRIDRTERHSESIDLNCNHCCVTNSPAYDSPQLSKLNAARKFEQTKTARIQRLFCIVLCGTPIGYLICSYCRRCCES